MEKSTYYNLVRVNKTRARNLYNNEYEVLLTMTGFRHHNHCPEYRAIWKLVDEEKFDRLVSDYYEENKGKGYSYRVEYWVAISENEEYVREYNKEQQRKHKANMNRK